MKINVTPKFAAKLEAFRAKFEAEQVASLHRKGLACEANLLDAKCTIKPGRAFIKVDVGTSGRYVVEVTTGNIFGIKGYGVVHRGHWYGTLDTINDYYWGNYYPSKVDGSSQYQKGCGAPAITTAPATASVTIGD